MRLLYSAPVSNRSLTYFLPNGSWGGFLLVYEFTNDTGNQATRADLGNVNLTRNGTPLINVDAEMLSYLNDLKGGFATFSSTQGSTGYAAILIPCGHFNDRNNAYLIRQSDKVYFKLDYGSLTDLAVSGNVRIYGLPKEGIQNYLYCITQRNVVAGGASTIADVHRLDNVAQMYLVNFSSVSQATIIRDNQTLIDALISDLKAFSDVNNQVETSTSIIELDLNLSKNVTEVISREIEFKYQFSGASTLRDRKST